MQRQAKRAKNVPRELLPAEDCFLGDFLFGDYPFVEIPWFKEGPRIYGQPRPIKGFLPDSPGLYFVVSPTCCVYIGKTERSLEKRISSHEKWRLFINNNAKRIYYRVEDKDLTSLEKKYIYFCNPILNINGMDKEYIESSKQEKLDKIISFLLQEETLNRLVLYSHLWYETYYRVEDDGRLKYSGELSLQHILFLLKWRGWDKQLGITNQRQLIRIAGEAKRKIQNEEILVIEWEDIYYKNGDCYLNRDLKIKLKDNLPQFAGLQI